MARANCLPLFLAAFCLAESPAAAQPAPKSAPTYTQIYGKTGAQPEVTARELPRIPAIAPAQAIGTFQVKPGFRLELAAAEPLVTDPITMAFDENGRLYVVEMVDYSERREEQPHLGRIRLLEDTDGDGKFDRTTIFAAGLPWPTALICYGGGIFVGATPDIVWLKDTNGDGQADERKVVFTGFGSGATRLNVQALINSFNWGLDNRIHGATGPIGGNEVKPLAAPGEKPLDLRGRDFSFDPRSLRMRAETGGGQYGLSFDSRGRKFVCSNSDHLQQVMYDLRYASRNPYYSLPNPRVSIASDGPAAEVFRISPDEPWRIVRTRWRVSGVVPGAVEGGGRVSGYFTGATGATIYRGHAYGPEFADNAFIGDAGGNLVHRKQLHANGVLLAGRRPADEQNVEFLASRDTWFRPVHFQNAPDGCLYIADMYREVIEHPWSIPEAIKNHLDLNSGNDRGRIYRIVPDGFQQPKPVRLGSATTAGLVATLEHENGWHRDTAARLLFERQDRRAVPLLANLLTRARSPLARVHALHALHGLIALDQGHILTALSDSDERVREHAVKLAEPIAASGGATVNAVAERLLGMVEDRAPAVRYQLAFSLGEIRHAARTTALVNLIRRDVDSPWVQAAVLSSMIDGPGEAFAQLARDGRFRSQRGSEEFLRKLAELIGARNVYAEVRPVLDFVARPDSVAPVATIVRALGDGAVRAGTTLAKVDRLGYLKEVFTRAAQTALEEKAAETARIQSAELLALTSYSDSGAKLLKLVDSRPSEALQLAAVSALGRFTGPEVGRELVQRWAAFSPRIRSEAATILVARPERAIALLNALAAGAIKSDELPAAPTRLLLNHRDKTVATLAAKILGQSAVRPADAIKQFQAAVDLRGDAIRGKVIFTERCASCHRAGAEGFLLGPDLVTMKTAGKEKLLASIIDPNAEVAPQFIAFDLETKDNESVLGLISTENNTSVTLRLAFGKETVLPRASIKSMKSQGQSVMPEGLHAGLTPQAMADLLEFIVTAEAAR